jgi:hypothetical protein
MIKYIKVNGKNIIEVRPLLPANIPVDTSVPPNEMEYMVDKELEAKFDKEFLRVDIPDGLKDIEVMQGYYYQNGKLVKTTEILDKKALYQEFDLIHIWLQQNDWIPNKVITEEWDKTDPRWTEYLKERKAKRLRLDEIRKSLGG